MPTFSKYTEVDEIYRKMVNIKLADAGIWEKLNDTVKMHSKSEKS